jgi:hypothetical protein
MHNQIPNIDLSSLEIDFNQFRTDLVNFYTQYAGEKTSISLKRRTNQTSNFLSAKHCNINTVWSDNKINLDYLNDNIPRLEPIIQENDYSLYNDEVIENFPYVIECISKIEVYTKTNFGRVRLFALPKMSLVSFHKDFGSIRYHIPIVTSSEAVFISDGKLYSMSKYDNLYKLPCDTIHCAINAASKTRLHLALVSTSEENKVDLATYIPTAIDNALIELSQADEVDLLLNSKYYNSLKYQVEKTQDYIAK